MFPTDAVVELESKILCRGHRRAELYSQRNIPVLLCEINTLGTLFDQSS